MSEVHRTDGVSLHVLEDGIVELRESALHGDVTRYTTSDDPLLALAHPLRNGGLSINEVCRRYADRADVDFEVAAAAVLDALEAPLEADSD
jgi:hypothetical protein